jgi:membrane dipeptidase
MSTPPAKRRTRRDAIRALAGAMAALSAPSVRRGRYRIFGGPTEYSARCLEIMGRSTVVDLLSPLTIGSTALEWASEPGSFGDREFAPYRTSGINAIHQSVGFEGPESFGAVTSYLAAYTALVAGAGRYFLRVDDTRDFARAKRGGKLGILLGVQNSEHFRGPADVDHFFGLGQRVSQLTYNARNRIGSGCAEPRDDGIGEFGVAIVAAMNRAGMAIDVSHCGDRTTLDAFRLSQRPVLVTHSNCRALNPGQARCKTDEAIRMLGKTGGVIGITGVRYFVSATEPTTIEDVLRHFDHVRTLIGSEHLAVGSDIDLYGYDVLPAEVKRRLLGNPEPHSAGDRPRLDIAGLDHPKRMFDLTEGLIRHRYSDWEIEGILGRNCIRVLEQIWPVVSGQGSG